MADHPATFTGHTLQGPVHVCVAHAQRLERVMRALGVHVTFTSAPEGAQCSNCERVAAEAAEDARHTGGSHG